MPLYMLALWRLSRRVDHSSFNLSCNLIGQRENKSRYVTEIVLPFGYADVIRDFKHRRRERQRRRKNRGKTEERTRWKQLSRRNTTTASLEED